MRHVHIDFRRRSVLARHGVLLVCVLSSVIVALPLQRFNSARLERDESRRDLDVSRADSKRALVDSVKADQLSDNETTNAGTQNLNWPALFQTLEGADTENVAVLELIADTSHGELSIAGQARDAAAMIEYAQRLSRKDSLSHVLIESYNQLPAELYDPLRFKIVARLSDERADKATEARPP